DAPLDVIMASLYLDSDTGEDAPQFIRDLRPSSSQLKIHVYPKVRKDIKDKRKQKRPKTDKKRKRQVQVMNEGQSQKPDQPDTRKESQDESQRSNVDKFQEYKSLFGSF
ncbi:hypothetical protein Tco_0100128, partial [Tanacetum coccineum]